MRYSRIHIDITNIIIDISYSCIYCSYKFNNSFTPYICCRVDTEKWNYVNYYIPSKDKD